MLDVRTTAEAPPSPTHAVIRREDYRPPDWLVPEIGLDFDLGIERTRVRATLSVQRNGTNDGPLRLDGDGLELISVSVDGKPGEFRIDGETFVIDIANDRATVETEVL